MAGQKDAEKALDLFVKIFNIGELVNERQEVGAADLQHSVARSPQASFQS